MKFIHIAIATAALSLTAPGFAQEAEDVRMMRLAEAAGCVICHSIGSGSKGPHGLKPIGPAWIKVAQKYRQDPDAVDKLTEVVMKGSDPSNSHWQGEISSGMGMPANDVVISETDARELVAWILNLAR